MLGLMENQLKYENIPNGYELFSLTTVSCANVACIIKPIGFNPKCDFMVLPSTRQHGQMVNASISAM